MKIHIISDLHDEFHETRGLLPVEDGTLGEVDFIVSAGDIFRGASIEHEKRFRKATGRPVIKVAGNHEHYKTGKTVSETIDELRNAAGREALICFLENDAVVLKTMGGQQVKFIGATLWTDFDLYADHGIDRQTAMITAMHQMNDYRGLIYGARDSAGNLVKLAPSQTRKWHQESVEFIVSELRKPFDGIRVVVTHHSPVPGCLNAKYQSKMDDRKLSPAFGSDLTWIFEDDVLAPDLWISGHGHNSFRFEIGKTLMVSNPRGYPQRGGGVENRDFDPGFICDSGMLPRLKPRGLKR